MSTVFLLTCCLRLYLSSRKLFQQRSGIKHELVIPGLIVLAFSNKEYNGPVYHTLKLSEHRILTTFNLG
jgi:hypothetical protein